MKEADLAMYSVKTNGKDKFKFFHPSMLDRMNQRAALDRELQKGLEKNEFELFYQPQYRYSGHIFAAEALVRWQHPIRGLTTPRHFIHAAEASGFVLSLGTWVLEKACYDLSRWNSKTERHITIAVNVSATQVLDPTFVQTVEDIVKRTNINPRQLKLELTESLLFSQIDEVIVKLKHLKSIGISFALDDFGTGYSSLAYLKKLPIDQLKMDQSFVQDMLGNPNDAVIARTIVALGNNLDMAVIAEGVESRAQMDFLERIGCNQFQGFYLSKPLAAKEFEALINHNFEYT